MSKAFVKDDAAEPETPEVLPPSLPSNGKNYITPEGFARLQEEKKRLLEVERPEVVKTVAWAASLGDRSENADYIYGKRRLREIDRRVRFLIKRLEAAEIVRSSGRDTEQIFFGAEVRVRGASGERKVRIVGIDETDATKGYVSWISPMARALIKAREGDTVLLRTPAGNEQLEILEVTYP
ncbi:MAG: transcription elongation factor GreB [Betaproteobacteria bacterium]|nr:transcription elongation factor GreB [Betaproteobacteria bacterium]